MKILQFPSYITINNLKNFSRNITGYGYMCIDIAISIASSGVDTDLITYGNITKGFKYKKVNIIKRTWSNVFLNFRLNNFLNAIKAIILDEVSIKLIPNYLLYYISMGYFEKVLIKNRYDLVHIHGIGPGSLPIISICKKYNIKYLVTLHGLNSFSDSIIISNKYRQLEKFFLTNAQMQKIPVSVISTGIKKTILNYLNITESDNFHVITNGCYTSIIHSLDKINIRDRFKINKNCKIAVCVGNITKNKNQVQIVRAYSILHEKVKNGLVIMFIGKDVTNGLFEQVIKESGNKENLIICGNIPKDHLSDYYKQASFNIVASISEGFGLSIIEGFSHGLPTLTFSNLDAVQDLYHAKAMCLVNERTDEAFAKGIEQILLMDWDKQFIQNYAENFSLAKMSLDYINLYERVINE